MFTRPSEGVAFGYCFLTIFWHAGNNRVKITLHDNVILNEALIDMQGNDKEIDQFISELKAQCLLGDIRPLSSKISELMGPYFIQQFRERKIILSAPVKSRRDIALCLLSCAKQLEQEEYVRLVNYLEFSIAGDMVRKQLLRELHTKLLLIGSCCESDLLALVDEIYNSIVARVMKRAFSSNVSGQVSHNERRLHDLNGRLVDLSNGLARLINEISRLGLINPNERPFKRRDRKRVFGIIRSALMASGELNAFEWIFDEVSFGHFFVSDRSGNGAHFRLDFTNTKMALMRRLATRRSFILKYMMARPKRYVRDELDQLKDQLLEYALSYYCAVSGISNLHSEWIEKARERVRKSLIIIDAEDDILYAASKGDKRIQSYYIAGFALSCFAIASEVVRDAMQNTSVTSSLMEIPLSLISEAIHIDFGESFIAEGLAALCVRLPARSHNQLNALPFVHDGNNLARPFLNGYSGMWNIMVRNALIQGGQLGKDVGAIWEEFIEFCFQDTAWRIVGKGIKLRCKGKLVTDVDLLLLQDDLLLVVQIKSLIGSADTPYDHWKNLQIIKTGCIQARKSADFLTENMDRLISICGKKASNKIRIIQPLVLTNINHLDGLNLFDVPVIGEATRKAICEGSSVQYLNANGQHLHTHFFVKQDQLDTQEILRLLKEPIELRIASERPETLYRKEKLGHLELLLPEFLTNIDPFQPSELGVKNFLNENT